MQVPIEDRDGAWRFAGASGSLAGAIRQVEAFADALQFATLVFLGREYNGLLRFLLEENDPGDEYCYPRKAPVPVAGPHRLVLGVRYGAPYEGLGACVVEIPSLAGSPYDQRAPETDFPKEWHEGAVDWVLEQGAERFGPVPDEVEDAIRAETRPEDRGLREPARAPRAHLRPAAAARRRGRRAFLRARRGRAGARAPRGADSPRAGGARAIIAGMSASAASRHAGTQR